MVKINVLRKCRMTPVTEQKIREMTRTIVREVRPEKVLLFGSWARGTAGLNSDVDLIVVEKKPFGPKRSRRQEMNSLWKTVSHFDFPTDILVYSQEEFDYWSGSLNHVVGRAVREGRTLYERH
jgi:predicted nucleotidyltransferase